MAKNTGGAAYPSRGGMMFYVPGEHQEDLRGTIEAMDREHEGMTLRDYFAAKALPSILEQDVLGIQAWEPTAKLNGISAAEYWAKNAYEIADAMIAERAK